MVGSRQGRRKGRRALGAGLAMRLAAAVGLLAAGGCDTISDALGLSTPTGDEAVSALPEGGEQIPYEAEIAGEMDDDLRTLLERSSQLLELRSKPPPTISSLERRVARDEETFQTALRSEGYYAARITHEIDEAASPVRVRILVEPGPAYTLSGYAFRYARPPAADNLIRDPADVGVTLGERAESAMVVRGETQLVRKLTERGYPLAEVRDRKAVVNHDRRDMTVTLDVDQGPLSGYGPVAVEGLDDVKEAYVRRLVPLEPGARYDQRQVEDARARLAATGLFNTIAIEPAKQVDAAGNIPLTVRLAERPHRTIGGGASYSTSEGFGGEAYWEHRNLFSENEKLRIRAVGAEIEQSLTFSFVKPHFLELDQNLLADLQGARRTTDAFDETSVKTSAGLERRFGKYWKGSAGLSAEFSVIDDNITGEKDVLLFGLPLTAARDTSDDALNPTRGSRLAFALTPYVATMDTKELFLSALAGGSAYFALDDDKRYVLAGRAKLGTIVGADTLDIPATKRFYAGGGGSIRGFEYQTAGPLDASDDPIGGRSLVELGLEMRIRITESIGIVPFVDAGSVFDEPYPDDPDLFYAAGIGGRYYTSFGPLRLDVAFPLNPRRRDDFFQFYVSLGQAF